MKENKKRWFGKKNKQEDINIDNQTLKDNDSVEITDQTKNTDENSAAGEKSSGKEPGQYKKDIKFLWIYSAAFCVVVLALIGISAVLQVKMRARLEYYQSQAENANINNTNSQSILKNIQDENAELRQQVTALNESLETLKQGSETDLELLQRSEQMLEQAEYLVAAQTHYIAGRRQSARTEFRKIEPELLDIEMKEQYESLKDRLGE